MQADVPTLDDLVDDIPDGAWGKESVRRQYHEALKALVAAGHGPATAAVILRNLYHAAIDDGRARDG